MRKAIALGVIGLAASLAFAVTVLVAQTQSDKPAQDASARHSKVKPPSANITPLNVNTGLWQMTEKVAWENLPPNLPPQYATMLQNAVPSHYKACVKTKDLSSNPWADGSGADCTWTVLNSTGTDMEVRGTSCSLGKGMEGYPVTMDVHGKIHVIDSENGTGSMAVTLHSNGQIMNGHADYTGKWIGATCPAEMN